MLENEGEFSVVQWFPNQQYEYVRRYVDAETAFAAAQHYCTCVGAKIGTTVRVIIEDGGGYACFDWNRREGVVFPEEFKGRWKLGDANA